MRFTLLITTLLITLSPLTSQQYFNFTDAHSVDKTESLSRTVIPSEFKVSTLKYATLKEDLLSKVPSENEYKQSGKSYSIALPSPDGDFHDFEIFETKMMEPGLAAKYPSIKTYLGISKSEKSKVYLGFGNKGFYAMIKDGTESYLIDNYAENNTSLYQSYYLKDRAETYEGITSCGTKDDNAYFGQNQVKSRSAGALLPLREYRFALACTGEFAQFFGPTVEDVLSEFSKSVNIINSVIENDFAIRLVLVDDTDKVIFLDKNSDPYPDGTTGGEILGANTNVLNNNIGFANYDLGHVYTRSCSDVGGVAFLRSICAGNKGGGVTCHYSDVATIAITVAAHEVGHQLGSNHTFNNCGGNENSGTAFEPGSGTTIMSYEGLCGPELNVTSNGTDYYHISSIIEITTYTREQLGDNCANHIETTNHIPDITIPIEGGFNIPISTPFELHGEAVDMDGDDLTYTWEQYNVGPTSIPGEPQGNSPLFVSRNPDEDPSRVFPDMSSIVNNTSDKSEVLPTYSRDLTFQFVVRDNSEQAGAVAWESIEFQADASAGPFLVEFPNSLDTFEVGEEVEVMWDVAGTDNAIIDCQSVDILLSTDGGYTYDKVLASTAANDGSHKVFMPSVIGDDMRIKIKASDNIFFDISNADFSIVEPSEPGFVMDFSPGFIATCVPEELVIDFTTAGFLDYDDEITLVVDSELPAGLNFEFENANIAPGMGTQANISFDDPSITGLLEIVIAAQSTSDTLYRTLVLDLTSTVFSDVKATFPTLGSSGNTVSPVLTWTPDSDADSYYVMVGDNPSFDPVESSILFEGMVTDTFFELSDILDKSQVYYWTVVASNDCGSEANPDIYTFATEALSCSTYEYTDLPAGITQSAAITIELPIEIFAEGQVSDVNIKKLRGTHTWVSELKAELVSPDGTSVLLFNNKCGNQSNFNCGFDDDAVTEVICPLNQGTFFKPQEKLDTFRGKEIAGIWNMKVTDTKVGNGGTVQEYILELCSNAVLENPFIVNNQVMPLPSGVGRRIDAEFLKVEDNNNGPSELVFTIVRLPQNGILRHENDTIRVGSQFTQTDINNKSIRYTHGGEGTEDKFAFTVSDGEGGWIDIKEFDIVIDNDVVLDVEETLLSEISVFPNPNNGDFQIQVGEVHSKIKAVVYDINGQKVYESGVLTSGDNNISIGQRVPGIYLLHLVGAELSYTRKIIVE